MGRPEESEASWLWSWVEAVPGFSLLTMCTSSRGSAQNRNAAAATPLTASERAAATLDTMRSVRVEGSSRDQSRAGLGEDHEPGRHQVSMMGLTDIRKGLTREPLVQSERSQLPPEIAGHISGTAEAPPQVFRTGTPADLRSRLKHERTAAALAPAAAPSSHTGASAAIANSDDGYGSDEEKSNPGTTKKPAPPPPQPIGSSAALGSALAEPRANGPPPKVARVDSILQAFKRIDTNDNGSLSRAEVVNACRNDERARKLLGLPQRIRQEDGTRDIFEELYQKMDKDGSKSVDRDEFVAFFLTRPPPKGTTPLLLPRV